MATRKSTYKRWWFLPGVLALSVIAFGLAAISTPARQVLAGIEVILATSTPTNTSCPTTAQRSSPERFRIPP